MSDSDDDWEKEDLPVVLPKKVVEEEEDLTVAEMRAEAAANISVPKPKSAEEKRREEELLANKLTYALRENETPEEKRRREKAQIEAADNELTNELMGSSISGGGGSKSSSAVSAVANASLKNKQDHVNFGITVAAKLAESTPFCLSAFYRELTGRIKSELPLDNLSEIIDTLTAAKEALVKKAGENTTTKKKPTAKEQKKKIKAHEDTFGGNYDEDDEYGDSYGQLEEDYMF